jgi:hypothetical protein
LIFWTFFLTFLKLDPTLARTSWGFLISTTAHAFSVDVATKEEGEEWIRVIKSQIKQRDKGLSPRSSQEEESPVKKQLETQVTFSLAIDRIKGAQLVNSTIYPNGVAIQYDKDKEARKKFYSYICIYLI